MLGPSLADIKKRRVLITRLSLVDVEDNSWKVSAKSATLYEALSEVSRNRPLSKTRSDLIDAIERMYMYLYMYTYVDSFKKADSRSPYR